MGFTDYFSILGSISLFAIAVVLVPTLLLLIRVLRHLDFCLQTLNQHIEPLCSSLTEAASELQILTLSLNDKVEKTEAIFDTAQQSANTLRMTATMLSEAVRPAILAVAGIGAGIKAFSLFFTKKNHESEV